MKTKALISCAVTVQLIYAFVFAYAKGRLLVTRLKKRLLPSTLIRAFVLHCSIVKSLFFQDLASICDCIGWFVSDLV